ncbi:hypothetical protein [Bradyrhizobium sp. DOA9]|uniref:hypothetical protein n=1 Tax=Bradyrhizobium sp. DOA9 TaxID=1126627 RepID=UPI00126037F7|nr:hypothetical protein [Bradyrhizobium sp. DOA9]
MTSWDLPASSSYLRCSLSSPRLEGAGAVAPFCFTATVEVLERVCDESGSPRCEVDQGSEFVSRNLDVGTYQRGLTLRFSRPTKPTDDAATKVFNGLRTERLKPIGFYQLHTPEPNFEV